MKKLLLPLLLLICSNFLFAQNNQSTSKTFVIEGKLTHFGADKLWLVFTDSRGERIFEQTDVDKEGNFYLETNKVDQPCSATLHNQDFFRTRLFIAPGSQLTLTADCTDKTTAQTVKSITGYGAVANQYLLKIDSISYRRNDTREPYSMLPAELPGYLKEKIPLQDSVYKVVFSQTSLPDNYYTFFKSKTQLDNRFDILDLLTYSVANDTAMSYQQAIKFIDQNADKSLLNDLYKDEYMVSDSYRTFMRDSYLPYLWAINKKKGLKYKFETYQVDIATLTANNFKGRIKQYTLYDQLHKAIQFSRSFAELNLYAKAFPPFIAQLTDKNKQAEIQQLLTTKEQELITTQTGKPAPALIASDNSGKSYNVTDFKGKVVLIDLWASWCGPCRQETPYLKKTVEKYKNDARIAIISVAVLDKPDEWKKAMDDDKPTWLQLYDTDGTVQRNYVARSIPKFILINKAGNIVSFDAPMPHFAGLEKMLTEEMSK
jgi:thiol-disulfide isomerase/thioredoxin